MLRIIASAASSPDMRAVLTMSSISRSFAETVSARCAGTKALQWIVRDQSLERLTLPSHAFVRDAVSLEICRVEGQQIPAPFGLQVGDVRPQPIERIEHLAAMLERETCRLPLVPILEAKKPGRGRTASEAPRAPGSADEQTTATTGLERGLTLACLFGARVTGTSSGADARTVIN